MDLFLRSDGDRCNTEPRPIFDSNSNMRPPYPPPRGLSKNECTDFQHALSNISAYFPESPENRGFREVSQIYESVSQKQHIEKTVRCALRKTAAASGVFCGKYRRKKRNSASEMRVTLTTKTHLKTTYIMHTTSQKRQALSVCVLTVAPDNERQSVRRIEAAAPAAVAGKRKRRRP